MYLFKDISAKEYNDFKEAFDINYIPLCVYVESIVRNKNDAEDIVQGIFCNIWEKRKNINIKTSFKGYLYSIARNSAINFIKHKKVKKDYIDFISKEKEIMEEINLMYDKEYLELLIDKIYKTINKLPNQCKEIFLLSRMERMSSNDISKKLGISKRTVENQIYRALNKIRIQLKEDNINTNMLLFMLLHQTK